MKHTIFFFFLILNLACAQNETAAPEASDIPVLKVSMYNSPLIDKQVVVDHPYDLSFELRKAGDGKYTMVTDIKLFGGSFYVSPHSTRDFSGKFKIEIAPNEQLKLGSGFVETPRSKEVIDPHPFVNGPVNWVKEDTRYEYPLIINSEKDFQIGGKIIFVIEPKCTLEEIPVMFKYQSGVLTIEKWKC